MKTTLLCMTLTAILVAMASPASALDHVSYGTAAISDLCTAGYGENATKTTCDGAYVGNGEICTGGYSKDPSGTKCKGTFVDDLGSHVPPVTK